MENTPMADANVIDEIVPAGRPWGHLIRQGEILRLVDLEGQQAVDFLCFDAADTNDRYSATNTIKVQGNIFVGVGTVLYSDRGSALLTVVADTCGHHDTIYGCCSEANNFLRYGVRGTPCCYANFCEILAQFGLDERSIVGNVNFFMSVPVLADGSAGSRTPCRRREAWSSCGPSATSSQCCRTARRCTTPATATTQRRSVRRSTVRRGSSAREAPLVYARTDP